MLGSALYNYTIISFHFGITHGTDCSRGQNQLGPLLRLKFLKNNNNSGTVPPLGQLEMAKASLKVLLSSRNG